jgi:hypothetical protein
MLSSEKTPSLCSVLYTFESMVQRLEDMLNDEQYFDAWPAIEVGIQKLRKYSREVHHNHVPAYTLATCTSLSLLFWRISH